MEKFKFLNHPNDLRAQVFGSTEEELLKNAALAMMNFLYPKQADFQDHEVKEKINLKEKNFKNLFFDFLEGLLELSNDKDICFNDFVFQEVSDTYIKAIVQGRRVKAKNDIKKIFDHNLRVERTEDGLIAEIVFDI